MLRINKQGFTLIELMVVIVIIGVLASLAIPRFTEASVKAKVAEAPRVIASFESAYLAAVAEGAAITGMNDLIFQSPGTNDSKWFNYDGTGVTSITVAIYKGTATDKIGGGLSGKDLVTTFVPGTPGQNGGPATTDSFNHSGSIPKKYVPNFKDTDN
jgi:prepilin-type N-terminal cleavage/methylation domain-containing protein